MSLINCPECGKEISDKAIQCIHCGCPVKVTNVDLINDNPKSKHIEVGVVCDIKKSKITVKQKTKGTALCIFIMGILSIIVGIPALIFAIIPGVLLIFVGALFVMAGKNYKEGLQVAPCPYCNKELIAPTTGDGITCPSCHVRCIRKGGYLEIVTN